MYYKKLMLVVVSALLGASFVQEASAWGTGGAVIGTRKTDLDGKDLFCDLSRTTFGGYTIPDAARIKIETTPSAADPGAAPSLTFSGEMFCAEVLPGTTGLESAVDSLVGRFRLDQISPAQRSTSMLTQTETGLKYTGPDANGVRTWTFEVPFPTAFPFPELLYDLVPADDATAAKFCKSSLNDCKALFGLQIPAKKPDYPQRDFDNADNDDNNSTGADLDEGQVFKFSTITKNGLESAGKLFWGPCHSQAFIAPQTKVVDAFLDSSNSGAGGGLSTGIYVSVSESLAITANENDLWNSGGCSPNCRYSNADGQMRPLTATGHDDSFPEVISPGGTATGGHVAGDLIGVDWKTVNGDDHSEAGRLSNKPFGLLVGSIGTQFFAAGTAYNNATPPSGMLSLFYWDSTTGDNTESVEVTIADKAIRCTTVAGEPTIAQGNTRGLQPIPVSYSPSPLNVTNDSPTATFPAAVLPTDEITFAPDGSPVIAPTGIAGTSAFINGSPTEIFAFTVSGNGELKLKLKNADVIRGVTPGGTCVNGTTMARLEIGSDAGGYFAGEAPITLKNCDKL